MKIVGAVGSRPQIREKLTDGVQNSSYDKEEEKTRQGLYRCHLSLTLLLIFIFLKLDLTCKDEDKTVCEIVTI